MAGRPYQLLFQTTNDLTLTVARIVLAAVFIGHGAQKMFGWWGGPGFSRAIEIFEQNMGIPPFLTVMAMVAEVFGGLGLLVGLLTRIAAAGVLVVMIVAPLASGLYVRFFMNWQGRAPGEGFEYHLLAIALILVVMVHGAGAFSIDRLLAGQASGVPERNPRSFA